MASSTIIQSCKRVDQKEEQLIDLDAGISETNLTLRNLIEIKNKLTQIFNLILHTFYSSLFEVTIEHTFPFQDFVHSIVKNYVKSNSHVLSSDDSRIICTINPNSVRRSLGLPMPSAGQQVTQFSKISSLSAIKSLTFEEVMTFMAKLLEPEVNQPHFTFPYDL